MFKMSVIVPCYNNEKDIRRALESCVNQTLKEIEIIVINDGSTDSSQNIIDEYVNNYPNKVFSHYKKNGGIASVRNLGISLAQGEYFGFLDGDDYAELTMYDDLYNEAKRTNADLVNSNYYWTTETNETIKIESEFISSEDMMINLFAVVWNKIYKTSFIRGLNVNFIEGYRFEDVSFLYKIAPYVNKFGHVDKPFIHYVQREGSYVNSHNHKVKEIVYVWEDLLKYYMNNGIYNKYYDELEYLVIKFMLGQPMRSATKIKDVSDRNKTVDMLFDFVNKNFHNWKKNRILLENKSMKNLYFRTVNPFTIRLYKIILKWI